MLDTTASIKRNPVVSVNYTDVVGFIENPYIPEEEREEERGFKTPVEVNAAASRLCEYIPINDKGRNRIYGPKGKQLEADIVAYLATDPNDIRGGLTMVAPEEALLALDILELYSATGRNSHQIFRDVKTVLINLAQTIESVEFPDFSRSRVLDVIEYMRNYIMAGKDDPEFRRHFCVYNDTLFKTCMTLGQHILLLRENDHTLWFGPASLPSNIFPNAVNMEGVGNIDAKVGAARIDLLGIDIGEKLPIDEEARKHEIIRRTQMVNAILEQVGESKDAVSILEAASHFDFIKVVDGKYRLHAIVLEIKRRVEPATVLQKKRFKAQAGGYGEKIENSARFGDMFTDIELDRVIATISPRSVKLEGVDGILFWQRLKGLVRAEYARQTFVPGGPNQLEQMELDDRPKPVEHIIPALWRKLHDSAGFLRVNRGFGKEEVKRVFDELGMIIRESDAIILPPQFVPHNWKGELTWWFPRKGDDLVALLRNIFPEVVEDHGPSPEVQAILDMKAEQRRKSQYFGKIKRKRRTA